MLLKAKRYDVDSARVRVVIHDDDCLELGIREGDRVSFGTAVAVVSRSDTVVRRGHILIPRGVMDSMGLKNGREVDGRYTPRPDSVVSIKRKMDGGKLSKDE